VKVRESVVRAVSVAVVAGSLLLPAASPAGAGVDVRATLFMVNGLPGGDVDVCISGLGEVGSRLPYGEKFKKRLDPGSYRIKVRKASRGECKGDVVAKAPLAVADLDNVTAVARYVDGSPGITTFDNDVSATEIGQIRLTAAHMMKGGPVDVVVNGILQVSALARETMSAFALAADGQYAVWGTAAGETTPIVGPRVIENTEQGQAFTFVMVGTKVANNRLVIFKQPVGTIT
jgi:hypothetical protein